MFVSQQLIPAANGFDHNGAQKDVRHFPAIHVRHIPCFPLAWRISHPYFFVHAHVMFAAAEGDRHRL